LQTNCSGLPSETISFKSSHSVQGDYILLQLLQLLVSHLKCHFDAAQEFKPLKN